MKRLLLLIMLLSGLSGCAAVVTSPKVRLQQINPTGIDSAGLNIEVNLLVNNPNRFDLTLQNCSYTLQVAGLPFGSGATHQTTTFPGYKETQIKIPVRIRHADLLELLKRQLDLDHTPYHLIAVLQVDTPLGVSSIPLDHQGQLPIPPQYRPDAALQRLKSLFDPR